ncbi:PITH domain-containing protein [Seminavis robusta]|uniref:PITH domain-containing protein n=1 Tax=Seminavis robusta TaxID=568900 RepID=A0A9N8DP07_9STRA|nr:PITH domain-containing protein [Seminavis robusta]|eukprot:Sro255_g100300.1 PITH domain-containing protein (219) ;mRNA; f:15711-16367
MDPPECSGHSHDHGDHTDDLGLSLRPQMDLDRVQCLNEEVANAGRSILKLHEERLSTRPSLTSPEDDPELLLTIPFTEAVSCQTISIHSLGNTAGVAAPRIVKLFAERENLDFDTARELEPSMTLELLPPHHMPELGTIDYPLRPAGRFQNISTLTIFVESNYDDNGEAGTEITYVGIKGKGTKMKRKAVDCVYESQGMPKDHKVPGGEFGNTDVVPE